MNKFKTFFRTLYRSVVDFNYYADILKAPFSFSLKYLFLLLFLVQFLNGIIMAKNIATVIPKLPKFIEEVKTTAQGFFPKDLVVTFNNGKVRTNVDEPYFIDLPKNLFGKEELKGHFITIDTKAAVEDIKKYDTAVLLTKNAFVFPDKNQGYRVQFLNDMKGYFMIDQTVYKKILGQGLPYLNYLPLLVYLSIAAALIVWPFFSSAFALLGKLIYLLIFSLILLVTAKIMSKNLGYKKVYQLAMHASTLPVIISFVSGLTGFIIPSLSLSAVLLLFMIFVFSKIKTS